MKIMVTILFLFSSIINHASCQSNPVIRDLKIINTEVNEDNKLEQVVLSFNYDKNKESIDFIYVTFSELKTCTNEKVISHKSTFKERLIDNDSELQYTFDLSKYKISTLDYVRLVISNNQGEYSNHIEIGDREKYYLKCN